jgi:hypothetical protein
MAIDLTDDPRLEAQIASNIGAGIGGYMRGRRQKRQLAEQREKKQFQQAATIKLLNSGLQGQELLAAMNEMPGAVDNQITQSLNQKALAQRASGQGFSADSDINELNKLISMKDKLHKWDGTTQQFTMVPGGETLLEGVDTGIKNVLARINAREEAKKAGVEDVAGVARQQLGIGSDVAETGIRPPAAVPQGVVGAGVGREAAEAIDTETPALGDVSAPETVDDIVEAAHGRVQQGLPRPTTQEEYDAIPQGSVFIDTDGKEKRKQ